MKKAAKTNGRKSVRKGWIAVGDRTKLIVNESEINAIGNKNLAYRMLVLATQLRNMTTTIAVSLFNYDPTGAVCQFVGPLVTAAEEFRETTMEVVIDSDDAFDFYNRTVFSDKTYLVEVIGNPYGMTKKQMAFYRKSIKTNLKRIKGSYVETGKFFETWAKKLRCKSEKEVKHMSSLVREIADMLGDINDEI